MSGAEALAGVSLVCNIIQIVTFVRDVVITYKSIEDNHSPDPRLAQMCEAVKKPYEGLIQVTQGNLGPMGEEEQALIQGAQKCVERTEELGRMVSRLSVPANSSRPRKTMMVIGRSVSSLWQKKEVAALEKDLERYQALVDTHLLRHISGNVRSSETQNLRSFAELDDRLKQILNSYKTDNAAIQGFISEQTEKTQASIKQTGTHITAHVDRQLAVTEHVIRSDLTALETSRLDEKSRAEQQERQKRVLESLYFPERNSRWNRIEENYPKTFGWVFSIPGEPQSESDDDHSDSDEGRNSTESNHDHSNSDEGRTSTEANYDHSNSDRGRNSTESNDDYSDSNESRNSTESNHDHSNSNKGRTSTEVNYDHSNSKKGRNSTESDTESDTESEKSAALTLAPWLRLESRLWRLFWIGVRNSTESNDDHSNSSEGGNSTESDHDHSDSDKGRNSTESNDDHSNGDEGRNSTESDTESEKSAAPTFAPWLRSESRLFWISGKPASGKSTLMKYIITNPKTSKYLQDWKPNIHIIHHFFWKPGVSMENSLDGMLCSILYQILEIQPSLVKSISRDGLDPEAKRSHHDWSTAELRETLFRLLKEADASFCIFLDGLDEAVEKLHKFEIKSLLDGLMQIDGVKICASSRPEPKFAKYFTETEQLAIHDLTSKDIWRLVKSRLKDMEIGLEFRRDLVPIVVSRAQGVFMWVILVLNSVEMSIERETPEECLNRVSRMAQDLHLLYKEMWDRATYHGIDRATATLYFNIIVKRRLLFGGANMARVTILDMALMADKDFLTTFFEDYDSVTAAELLDLVEKTKKRVELGTAGLLEFEPYRDPDPDTTDSAAPVKTLVRAVGQVVFTHRSVFDFFTDSEYGRNILLESSVTNTEFFARWLKSVMISFRYLRTSAADQGFGGWIAPCAQIIRLIGSYEAYDPETSATADEMVKTLREWHLKGCFNSVYWEQVYRQSFSCRI